MLTHLDNSRTLMSLKRKEILDLPGFKHLDDYLYKELKEFVRQRVHELTNKKRGYKVREYLYDYDGTEFQPPYQTNRKSVRNRARNEATDKVINKIKVKRASRKRRK